jgi:methylthioribose-1-phosphate isomerase
MRIGGRAYQAIWPTADGDAIEAIRGEDVALNRRIGDAGRLATVDWGTATAPIYMAQDRGVPLRVFVDETRPRNPGAALAAVELGQRGTPHAAIVDNAGGHLMQRGQIDLVIVGADRAIVAAEAAALARAFGRTPISA